MSQTHPDTTGSDRLGIEPAALRPRDWTVGPPKWAAAVVLGVLGSLGLLWTLATGRDAQPTAITAGLGPGGERLTPPATLCRVIDLNTAPASELELLPGIGPALAARIVEDRQTRGPFESVADLTRVRGIGDRLLDRIRPHATVSQPGD